ncbi:hypothetical protein ACGFXC_04710 [Streptomyces sp. NPDC048507]|uniref:hypothetical protein n=1 Tax=Streptomyces sp. NPDC048507 TaxID=3365560 RepID=UPI003713DC10
MTITKMTTLALALAAGAAALASAPAAVADGPDPLAKPLAGSAGVADKVVNRPDVAVHEVVGAVGKVARTGEVSNG